MPQPGKNERLPGVSAGHTSVFEEDRDSTELDSEYARNHVNKRWKFKGPWITGMTDGEFDKWLEKSVRKRRCGVILVGNRRTWRKSCMALVPFAGHRHARTGRLANDQWRYLPRLFSTRLCRREFGTCTSRRRCERGGEGPDYARLDIHVSRPTGRPCAVVSGVQGCPSAAGVSLQR